MRRIAWVLLIVLTGCGDDAVGLHARFELPQIGEPIPVSDVPWPNDAHVGADGVLHTTAESLPFTPQADQVAIANIVAALGARDCFGVTSGVIFPLDGTTLDDPIDAATLVNPAVRLIDLTTGDELPIDTHYRPAEGQIFVQPRRGVVLEQQHTYAALISTSLQTIGGTTVAQSPTLSRVLRGEESRAQAAYAPLVEFIAGEGTDTDTIAGAAVFTTCDYDSAMESVRDQLDALDPPTVTITRIVEAGPDLDDLLGTPVDNSFPGADNPGGIAHADIAAVILGTFDAPNFQSDVPGGLGAWELDAGGAPMIKGYDDVPFLLVLPDTGGDFYSLPIVVFQHGINNMRTQVLEVANSLAARGFAVIGIDIPFHGDRFPDAVDFTHNITDAPGADGIADSSGPTAAMVFYDIVGDDYVTRLDPQVMQSSFRQAAVDMMSLSRLVAVGDWTDLTQVTGYEQLTFESDRIIFGGESFGGIIGAVAVAFDRRYQAAFLSSAGGSLMLQLLENSPVYGSLFLPIIGGALDVPPNDVDPAWDPAHTHYAFQIMGPLLDGGDSITYAHRYAAEGVHVALATAYADESVPNQSSETLASVAGLEWLPLTGQRAAPRYVPDMPMTTAPASGNITTGDEPITSVVFQLDPATHGMMTRLGGQQHYDPAFPPFIDLPSVIEVQNPIVELQTMFVAFAQTYYFTGTPVVSDPF